MSERKPKMTAAELMKSLEADPTFIAMTREREQKLAILEAAFSANERPLVQALNAVGFPVRSVWDLVNTTRDYERAIPILAEHFSRPYHPKIREGIARSLIVDKSKGIGTRALVAAFRTAPTHTEEEVQVKTIIGMAIATLGDEMVEADVRESLQNTDHGTCRALLPKYYSRVGGLEVNQILIDSAVGADPEMIIQILETLLDRNATDAKPFAKSMTEHPNNHVAQVARRVLTNLGSKHPKSAL